MEKEELRKMRAFYELIQKRGPVDRVLSWSHYVNLLPLKNVEEVKYYISIIKRDNLSKRALVERIKSNEFGKEYTFTELTKMYNFYILVQKVAQVAQLLT